MVYADKPADGLDQGRRTFRSTDYCVGNSIRNFRGSSGREKNQANTAVSLRLGKCLPVLALEPFGNDEKDGTCVLSKESAQETSLFHSARDRKPAFMLKEALKSAAEYGVLTNNGNTHLISMIRPRHDERGAREGMGLKLPTTFPHCLAKSTGA